MNKYDELEVEYCGVCTGLYLLNTSSGVMCRDCGALDYYSRASTIYEYEELLEKKNKDLKA